MKRSIYLAVIVLAGCATSPAYLREHGNRYEFAMQQPPSRAAACVARNTENGGGLFGHLETAIRDAATPGNVELVIYTPDAYLATAEFAPAGEGSKATVWLSSGIFYPEKLKGQFRGC